MNQALYAHMKKKKKEYQILCEILNQEDQESVH
jgi:hypothetical protein